MNASRPTKRARVSLSSPSKGDETESVRADVLAKSAGRAYDEIRMRIVDGRLPPGMRLKEHVLAEEVGVSRTPVREALRRLSTEGFVTLIANQGAAVTEWDARSLAGLIEVRSEIAALAARLAALRITTEQIDMLRELVGKMARLPEQHDAAFLSDAAQLNTALHRVISDASGNEWVRTLLDQTAYLPLVQRATHAFTSDAWKDSVSRYQVLISALERKDAEWASALIKVHFLSAKNFIMQQYQTERGVDEVK